MTSGEPARPTPRRPVRLRRVSAVARFQRSLLWSPVVGVLAGLAALLLDRALGRGTELLVGRVVQLGGAEVLVPHLAVLLLPALGGLASGVFVHLVARQAPGQGTDQMVRAFHREDGRLPLVGPAAKAVASVAVIACGGSAGPEGPIAGLGAGIGSALGGRLGLTPWDRRVLLVAGCAAGVGAIFDCPLGGALFAASVLYRRPEFEGSALVAAFVASALGFATFQSATGFEDRMLTSLAHLRFTAAWELLVYAALGALCGATAILFASVLRLAEATTNRARGIPLWLKPALGGLLTGALACLLPQVMDGRYELVRNLLDGSIFTGAHHAPLIWALFLLAVVVAKCVATATTVGSGAAGGVLGPSLFLGGVVGAFLGTLLQGVAPGLVDESLRQALVPVGMAGVLAAAFRVPLAAVVIAMEMTGSFGLIVPLMVVTTLAYLVGGRYGLIEDQVNTAADSPAHAGDLLVGVLDRVRVMEAMQGIWPAVAERGTPLARLVATLPVGEPPVAVVLEGERLVGIVSFAELHGLLDHEALGPIAVAEDLMTTRFERLTPNTSLYEALCVLERSGSEALPVVAGPRDDTFLGVLTRGAVRAATDRHLADVGSRAVHEHPALTTLDEHDQIHRLLTSLPPGHAGRVQRMRVPGDLVGQSLREADFRRRMGGTVLAVRTRDRKLHSPPDPAQPLEAADELIVLTDRPPGDGEEGGEGD